MTTTVVPARRGPARWLIIVIGAVVVAVVAALLIVPRLGGSGAVSLAERYSVALGEADAATLNELARLDPSAPENRLLTQDVYDAATLTPQNVEMQSLEETEGLAIATIRFDGGTMEFTLSEDDEGWFVSTGVHSTLGTEEAPVDNPRQWRVTGSDTVIRSDDEGVRLYPGTYELLPPNEFYVIDNAEAATFEVYDAGSTQRGPIVELAPSELYVAGMQKLVNAHIDECVGRVLATADELYGCGLPAAAVSPGETVSYTVIDYPVVTPARRGVSILGANVEVSTVTPEGREFAAIWDLDALSYISYGEVVGSELSLVIEPRE